MKIKVLQTIRPESGFWIAPNWPKIGKMTMMAQILRHDVIVKLFWRCLVSFVKFSFWSKFMSISSLVLELRQFSFIMDWPEILKLQIPLSDFCPISGDWGELGIPHLARMSLMKCYWMLQYGRVATFTVSELLRENQQVE